MPAPKKKKKKVTVKRPKVVVQYVVPTPEELAMQGYIHSSDKASLLGVIAAHAVEIMEGKPVVKNSPEFVKKAIATTSWLGAMMRFPDGVVNDAVAAWASTVVPVETTAKLLGSGLNIIDV